LALGRSRNSSLLPLRSNKPRSQRKLSTIIRAEFRKASERGGFSQTRWVLPYFETRNSPWASRSTRPEK
jgi:hypothetical protein